MESTVEVGAEPPVTGSSVEVSAGTAEAPVGAVDVPPAHEEDEAGVLQLEVNSASSCMPLMLRHIPSLYFIVRASPDVPDLAPVKALKLRTSLVTGRRLVRASRALVSVAAAGEPSRTMTAAARP
jgi:hypothetical protein